MQSDLPGLQLNTWMLEITSASLSVRRSETKPVLTVICDRLVKNIQVICSYENNFSCESFSLKTSASLKRKDVKDVRCSLQWIEEIRYFHPPVLCVAGEHSAFPLDFPFATLIKILSIPGSQTRAPVWTLIQGFVFLRKKRDNILHFLLKETKQISSTPSWWLC